MHEPLDLRTPSGKPIPPAWQQALARGEVTPAEIAAYYSGLWTKKVDSTRRTIAEVAARYVEGPHIVTTGPRTAENGKRDYEAELLVLLRQIDSRVPWERDKVVFQERKFRPDLFVRHAKFAVEIDGGVHRIKTKALEDYEKRHYMMLNGWYVVPIANEQIKNKGWQMAQMVVQLLRQWESKS